MAHLPFSVFKRKGRRFFYVQFKSKDGGYLPAVSTKQTTEEAAIEVAFKWLRDGKPEKIERPAEVGKNGREKYANVTNISISLRDALRDVKTPDEADFIFEVP